ncbi:MAG: serine hydrolase domain-containing protein [Chloroflexota bacterium]
MIDFDQIQTATIQATKSSDIVAVGVAVVEHAEVTYAEGFGRTRLDDAGVAVTADTLFPYCSVSKTFNAILVMRLVEEGRLDLDCPVVDYLPGFTFRHSDYGQRVTLRHLLSHTSGLPMGGRFFGLDTDDALARAIWGEIPHYRFLAPPGLVTNYSNTVVCMAGYIAEVVMGRSYDDLLTEYLFEPLGMTSARWDISTTPPEQLIFTHLKDMNGQITIQEEFPLNRAGHPSSFYKGSIRDLAQVAHMYLNPGRLLGANALAEMMTPYCSTHLDSATHLYLRQELAYGLGLMVGDYRQHKMVRHAGGRAGHTNFFQLFPNQDRAVIILTSNVGGEGITELVQQVQDAVLGLESAKSIFLTTPPVPIAPPPSLELAKLAGHYLNPTQSRLVEITLDDGALTLHMNEQTYPLTYCEHGEFCGMMNEQHVMPVYFITDEEGSCHHVTVFGTPYQKHTETLPTDIAHVNWANYVGHYRDPFNTHPDDILKVNLVDRQLYIYGGDTPQLARPLSKHRFLTMFGIVEFEMSDSANNHVIAVQIAHAARYFPVAEQNLQPTL